jgi:hypothetical protein
MLLDSPVTWEGPDRFRVINPWLKSLTWSRREGVNRFPQTHIPIGPE